MVVKPYKFKTNFKLLDIKQANQQLKSPTSSKGMYKAIHNARKTREFMHQKKQGQKKQEQNDDRRLRFG